MKNKRPTMKDVAKMAGVTQATVSYVINDSANISTEVKTRVRDAIKELNYKPNYHARALKTNKSNMIGIIVPDIVNQYFAKLIETLQEKLNEKKYQTIIYSTLYDGELELNAVRQLLDYNVFGIVVFYQFTNPLGMQMLKDSGKSVVAVESGSICLDMGIPCVNINNVNGGYNATNYLIKKGCRRIAFIQENTRAEALNERRVGYEKAMEAAGLLRKEDIFLTTHAGQKWSEGRALAKKLVAIPFDAIITSSDIVAAGIIEQLKRYGKNIPEDIRVIGWDNIPLSELIIPSLTTMAQPISEACALAMQLILRSPDEQSALVVPELQQKLVIRESA